MPRLARIAAPGVLLALGACAPAPSEVADQRAALVRPAAPSVVDDPLDEPGDHGRSGPWVECPALHLQTGTDPLGPVVAHGLSESPGYRRIGMLSRAERLALRRSELRQTNRSLLRSGVLLSGTPSDPVVLSTVRATLILSGFPMRDVDLAIVDRPRPIVQLPELESAATPYRLAFEHAGARIEGGLCHLSLSSPGSNESSATVACEIPTGAENAPTFLPFRISSTQAEAIARQAFSDQGSSVTLERRYSIANQVAEPAWLVRLLGLDGKTRVASIDGGDGRVRWTDVPQRSFVFEGFSLDWTTSGGPKPISTPVEPRNPLLLDSHPAVAGRVSCAEDAIFGTTVLPSGFVVCKNRKAARTTAVGVFPVRSIVGPRPDGDFTNPSSALDPLGPLSVSGHLINVGGFTIPKVPLGEDETYSGSEVLSAAQVAPTHVAEAQAFSAIGELWQWYRLLGYPSTTSPDGAPQDPHRLEIVVHSGATETSVSQLDLGFLPVDPSVIPPPPNAPFYDVVFEGSIVAHEYQHHLQYAYELDLSWEPDAAPPCDHFGGPASCPRTALVEGIADAFSMLYLEKDRTGLVYDPSLEARCPDVGRDRNSFKRLLRYGCNSVSFGYWDDTATSYWKPPTDKDSTTFGITPYSPHRRGSIVSGALLQWTQRLVGGGRLKELPALMIYEGEAALVGRFSDERDFLRMLLTSIRSRPGLLPRYAKHAALAFARKNVFAKAHTPSGSLLVPDQISCDGCPPASALSVIQRTMSVDLPLRAVADDPPPQVQVFAPTGDAYERQLPGVGSQNFVTLEFSTSPSFASLLTSQQIPLRSTSDTNNAPPGFTVRALTVANWAAIKGAGVVYYRVRQCLAGGSSTECIVTSVAGRPNDAQFIEIAPGSGGCGAGNCAVGGRPSGKTQPLLTLALGLAVFVVRSRRRAS